jgi:predicted ATPase
VQFTVLPVGGRPPSRARRHCYLITDNWDDWFRYNTQYYVVYIDDAGEHHDLGSVKVGEFDMASEQRRAEIPDQFRKLDPARFFSLGQDVAYYDRLNGLGADVRDEILVGLNDVALSRDTFERALRENVTHTSLLRYVPRGTVEGQFRRLAMGGARLSEYRFSYTAPVTHRSVKTSPALSFEVAPESHPPTNVHVLIGRNGVGKTTLLTNMTRALVGDPDEEVGEFAFDGADDATFANLVSVSFSAFDSVEPPPPKRGSRSGTAYTYIGIKRQGVQTAEKPLPPKTPGNLAREFGLSVQVCVQGERLSRWQRALSMLEADPIFADAEVAGLADSVEDEDAIREAARALFKRLSSGHKIVLLTITRLVESVEERSLVLIDEPEAHLHPPLLSAFIRALSDLLINRNGVAVIATHSPVVLQEVPRSCVWMLRRSGWVLEGDRPQIETFGENVGLLTHEVFGLEVTRSGFHRLLEEAVDEYREFEEAAGLFDNELGGEARGILRGLLASRDQRRTF